MFKYKETDMDHVSKQDRYAIALKLGEKLYSIGRLAKLQNVEKLYSPDSYSREAGLAKMWYVSNGGDFRDRAWIEEHYAGQGRDGNGREGIQRYIANYAHMSFHRMPGMPVVKAQMAVWFPEDEHWPSYSKGREFRFPPPSGATLIHLDGCVRLWEKELKQETNELRELKERLGV